MRVVIADDSLLVRAGIAALLRRAGCEVVAEAASGEELLLAVDQHEPDVAVVDVSMPDGGGADATVEIIRSCPGIRVLALSRHADQASLRRMLGAGASGYVVKRAAAQALIGALRSVLSGGTYVDPMLAGDLVARAIQPSGFSSPGQRRTGLLSDREEAVLRHIAWGKSNKEVASALGISVKTAEGYRANGLEKLKLRTRSDVLRYALAQGWLADEGAFG